MSTATTALPAWVTATCPDWCMTDHKPEDVSGEDSEIHVRRFGPDVARPGDPGWIVVGVEIRSDGTAVKLDGAVDGFQFDDPGAAEALEQAAATLLEAAAWIRKVARKV